MAIGSQHITGFVIGLGAAAAGFYFYKKNQKRVDEWLGRQGIHLAPADGNNYGSMTLEELVRQKENLEDLIAEREHAAEQKAVAKKPRGKRKRIATKASQPESAGA